MRALVHLGPIASTLRHRNFAIYTAGGSVSLIGTWMQRIAVGWLAWELSHSGAVLGLLAFADLFRAIVIGLAYVVRGGKDGDFVNLLSSVSGSTVYGDLGNDTVMITGDADLNESRGSAQVAGSS